MTPILKTVRMQKAELAYQAEFGELLDIREILQRMLIEEGRSEYYIAGHLGVTYGTLLTWLKQFGFKEGSKNGGGLRSLETTPN